MKLKANRYLACYTILAVAGLLSVAAINYKVDPAHLFSGGEYEKGIADFLLSGNNVGGLSDYDERLTQKFYIAGLSERKEVIVLGSSRLKEVRSGLFSGRSFFNHSVSAANLEDYLAIYQLYNQRSYVPSIAVFGLEPYFLKENRWALGWTTLTEEYLEIAKSLSIPVTRSDLQEDIDRSKLKELFSLPYFRQSLNGLFSQKEQEAYFPTKDSNLSTDVLLSDGSRVLGRYPSVEDVERVAAVFHSAGAFLDGFTELDKRSIDMLVTFVEYLQKSGVEVVFYLPPYHPTTYNMLLKSSKFSIVLREEEVFRNIARNHGIKVAGGYNPADSSSTREEFYDYWHPRESSVKKAFANMK